MSSDTDESGPSPRVSYRSWLVFRPGPACLPEMGTLKQLGDSGVNLSPGGLDQRCACYQHAVPARRDLGQVAPDRLAHQTPRPVPLHRLADALAGDQAEAADRPSVGGCCQGEQRVGPGLALASNAAKVGRPSEPILSLHRWIGAEKRAANPTAGLAKAAIKPAGYAFQLILLTWSFIRTDSWCRPRSRRSFRTCRPPFVFIRWRKPWTRTRRRILG